MMNKVHFFIFLSLLLSNASAMDTYKCESIPNPKISFKKISKVNRALQIETYCKTSQKCYFDSPGKFKFDKERLKQCVDQLTSAKDKCGGITPTEVQALKDYTASYYININSSIWKGDTKCKGVITVLNQALDRIPNYQGWVFRGTNLPLSVRQKHRKGNIVNYKAFASTSTANGWGGQDQFMIYSKTGASIDYLSNSRGENEVLFATGTRFKVLETVYDKDTDVKLYFMLELTSGQSKKELQNEESKLLKQIDHIVKYSTKRAKEFMLPMTKNLMNATKYTSYDHWICEDGIEKDFFFPQVFNESNMSEQSYSDQIVRLEELIKDEEEELKFFSEPKNTVPLKISKKQIYKIKKRLQHLRSLYQKYKHLKK